tara:strand:- start:119 stop:682 length:564 start_codon:yes stop_codon:yes gene_type:complete
MTIIFTITACKSEVKKTMDTPTKTSKSDEKKEIKEETRILYIDLNQKNDSGVIAKAKFEQTSGVVLMTVSARGLSEGTHAIHIHEKSDCSSEDGKSAGGHWNPTAKPHGKWGSEKGYHKGDIGNFEVTSSDEDTIIEFKSDEWCIGCGDPNKDILGKGVIVHQGEDDFTSQPSGAAGSRISCGGIIE